jgi:hypothetical protein
MQPDVRHYSDPLEGLQAQMIELRGLSRKVPAMIEADRQRRWDEINVRPSDGEDGETIDVFSDEAGREEGYGFADFGRTVRASAVVFAWAVLEDYLVQDLRRRLTDGTDRQWGSLDLISSHYRNAGAALTQLPGWEAVKHAQVLRNALVHNQGQYTTKYLAHSLAYRPTADDLHGWPPPTDDAELVNRQLIPLPPDVVEGVIAALGAFAARARQALEA